MHARNTTIAVAALAVALAASLAPAPAVAQEIVAINDTQSLAGTSIHSWTKTDAAGNVIALGVTFPAALLNALPAETTETVLEIPRAA
ncbi:MAG TPA: DUF5602 domain-containing protein, partial [Candidatus Dormibacteraeota bacterium]|nr:DUF5602 domain-containing protein [Candidatus Dormibacteraeota bacterium]